jgi:hypothetical protein
MSHSDFEGLQQEDVQTVDGSWRDWNYASKYPRLA